MRPRHGPHFLCRACAGRTRLARLEDDRAAACRLIPFALAANNVPGPRDAMIRIILEELDRANLVKQEHCSWNVRFGRSTHVQIFTRGRLTYNVKVSKTSVDREFQAMRLARQALG